MLVNPKLATCRVENCAWELAVTSAAEADRRLAAHLQLRHAFAPLEGVKQLDTVSWREQALDGIRTLAAKGEDFRFYDLRGLGIPDPVDPQHQWGILAKDVHRLRIAHPVDYERSSRPGTKGSSLRVWNASPARCLDCAVAAS